WIQNRWDVVRVLHVPPGAFSPPPEVDSEVVLLTPRETPRIAGSLENRELFERLLKAAFSSRRKMLRSVLAQDPKLKAALDRSGVDPQLRAEALTWDAWSDLLGSLANTSGK